MVSELAQVSAKILFTGFLLLITLLLVREMWRLWFDDSLTLVQFEFFGGETADREAGQHFTQLVRQDLGRLVDLYHGRAQSQSVGRRANEAQPAEGGTAQLLLLSPVSSATVSLPEVDRSVWSSFQTEVYGIPVARLAADFYNWIRQPAQIKGRVSKESDGFRVYAELRNAPRSIRNRISAAGGVENWQFARRGEVRDASFALACRIYRMLASAQSEVFARISDEEFLRFNQAYELYERYVESQRSGQMETASLTAAGDIVQGLVDRNLRFPHAYKLAAYVFEQQGKEAQAARAASLYLDMLRSENVRDDDTGRIQDLANTGPRTVQDAAALGLQQRKRPIEGGASVGSGQSTAGTICCIVQDRNGTRFALSAEHPLIGPPGTPIYQPGRYDGGTDEDRIGTLERAVSLSRDGPNHAAGAIARLEEGVEASLAVAAIGELQGIATAVAAGTRVRMVGRTSGLVEGTIKAVNASLKIPTAVDGAFEPTLFEGMILTTPISKGGDSGAPVVTEDNHLVGLVYAGSSQYTVVMPIGPVLEALGVALAR